MAFRRVLTLVGALALVAATAAPSSAQEKRKLNKDETVQYEALHALVDAVSSGKQPAPSDVKLTFHNYFIKSEGDLYIPFTLELQPAFSLLPVGMYVRAVAKTPPAAAAPAAAGRGGRGGRGRVGGGAPPADGSVAYAFEDIAFYATASTQIERALELAPGDYDLYFALSERASKDKKAPAPKTTVSVQSLTVPDMFAGLTTSSVILAKSIEAATQQLNGQQQLEQPYTIAGYKITPALSTSFPKTGELVFVFFVYNEGAAAANKPDVDVDYNFYHAGEEKPFTKLQTASFNAQSLPPEFNLTAGHQVFVGQGIPLATFAPGDYKFEIKVTDKTNSQSVIRNINFTVTP
jgi:hypothetical protein